MSLRDTINAATKEAQDGGLSFGKKAETADAAAEKPSSTGFTKKSTAKAKPAREAGASVRVSSEPPRKAATQSGGLFRKKTDAEKESEKADRRKRREEEDFRRQGYQILLNRDESYRKSERVWWIVIGVGFAFTIASLVMTYVLPDAAHDLTQPAGKISIGLLFAAYACIIGAFVYDWRKRRPARKEVERKVDGMTQKKLSQLFEEERTRRAAEEAEKKAKRAAKK